MDSPILPISTPCPANHYKDPADSICKQCDPSCSSCFGPSTGECYSYSFLYYYDGSRVVGCDSGCYGCWGSGNNQCRLCLDTEYLDESSTCRSSCDLSTSFVTGISHARRCITKCPAGKYILSNYTCVDSCDPPFVSGIDSLGHSSCTYPCPRSIHSFLYWDGSCLSTCPYYKRVSNDYYFCDACQPGYYSYDSGSCLPKCYTGFNMVTVGGSNFCKNPCSSKQFLYPDKTCKSTCPVSFIEDIGGSLYCSLDLSQADIAVVTKTTAAQAIAGAVVTSCGAIISTVNSANPASVFLLISLDMLQYLGYVKIRYPSKLQLMLDSTDSFSISIIPDMPDKLVQLFPNSSLPSNFQKYNLPSPFLVNFWHPGINLIALAIALGVILTTEKCTKKCGGIVYSYCLKAKCAIKWNLALVLFMSTYGQIVLFSSFEFRTINVFRFSSIISFLTCITMNAVALYILIRMTNIIISRRRSTTNPQTPASPIQEANWTNCTILFEEFKDQFLLQQAYVPISIVRTYLFYVIIAYLYPYPLAQMVIITVLSVLMVLYLVILRPPKQKITLAEYIVPEVGLLLMNVCFTILAGLDASQPHNDQKNRNLIGEIIIGIKTGLGITGATYFLIRTFINAVKGVIMINNRLKARGAQKERLERRRVSRARSFRSSTDLKRAKSRARRVNCLPQDLENADSHLDHHDENHQQLTVNVRQKQSSHTQTHLDRSSQLAIVNDQRWEDRLGHNIDRRLVVEEVDGKRELREFSGRSERKRISKNYRKKRADIHIKEDSDSPSMTPIIDVPRMLKQKPKVQRNNGLNK